MDSFSTGLLEHPQYTRPANFNGWKYLKYYYQAIMPKIDQVARRTIIDSNLQRRKELLETAPLTDNQKKVIRSTRK